MSIKKLKLTSLHKSFSESQYKVIRCFIASRSKLEDLTIEGDPESSDALPKFVKLPLKRFNISDPESYPSFNCQEFILNCRPTLEFVRGGFPIATHRVLMKSLKLKEMTWESADDSSEKIKVEEIESMETNRSIKSLTIEKFNGENDALNALIQKCEAIKSLEICSPHQWTDIHSSKVKTLKLYGGRISIKQWLQCSYQRTKFPNVENLQLEAHAICTIEGILEAIAKQKWNLKYLKLINFIKISPRSIKYLLDTCPTVKVLIIPTESMKLTGNWLDRESEFKFFDDYISKGSPVFALSHKFNIETFEEDREVLTQISTVK